MTNDEIVSYILKGEENWISMRLKRWFEANNRFGSFVRKYRDQIRKKIQGKRSKPTLDSIADSIAELEVAFQLLSDVRFDIKDYRKTSPDFYIAFATKTDKSVTELNLEVTRLQEIGFGRKFDKLINYIINSLCKSSLGIGFSIEIDRDQLTPQELDKIFDQLERSKSRVAKSIHECILQKYNELSADIPAKLTIDDEGNLWMSTNQGLIKCEPETETLPNYSVKDALKSMECQGLINLLIFLESASTNSGKTIFYSMTRPASWTRDKKEELKKFKDIIDAKLYQMRPDEINVLTIISNSTTIDLEDLDKYIESLTQEENLLQNKKDLSAILLRSTWKKDNCFQVKLWVNPNNMLPSELSDALIGAFQSRV